MTEILDWLVRAVGPEITLLIVLVVLLILAWLIPLYCLRRFYRKVRLLEQQLSQVQNHLASMNRYQMISRVQGRLSRGT